MVNEQGKSDRPRVPTKSPNKAGRPVAEATAGRGLATGNPWQPATHRTQRRAGVPSGLERGRQAARRARQLRLTALLHPIAAVDTRRAAYLNLKRDAAPGVDGETWQRYGEHLEANLQALADRLKRGAYRASPVRRASIPQGDGRQRPLGAPALEDKSVQRATVEALNAIDETDFLGCSYGFRPGRNQQQALAALDQGLMTRNVKGVLDADLRGVFDTSAREWLVKMVEHRSGDRRVGRLIQQWLRAGVLEDGAWTPSEAGTPPGGSASPVRANRYRHDGFDLWVQRWRQTRARGAVIVVRFADDFIVGFQARSDAVAFLAALRERLTRLTLALHPEQTRLIEVGRDAVQNRPERGLGKPAPFNCLGFTHRCGRARNGKFTVVRQTMRERLRAKLREVKAELRRRWHTPIPEAGNHRALARFRTHVGRLWQRSLARRSQRARVPWARMVRLIQRWLPPVRI